MKNKILFFIRDYFGFSATETNGFITLIFIMLLTAILPYWYAAWLPELSQHQSDQQTLDSLVSVLEQRKIMLDSLDSTADSIHSTPSLFEFDPNDLELEDWKKLGISSSLANRILNYVKKGGRFRQKSDLKKIYGFPETQYALLEPYISLPEKIESKWIKEPYKKKEFANKWGKDSLNNTNISDTEKKNYVKKNPKAFELNHCTAEELQQIKGIGEKLSLRILEYRDRLGGYYSKSQLAEVYGLEQEVIDELFKYASIGNTGIKLLKINQASLETLKNHPYIGYKAANVLLKYRKEHKEIKDFQELSKIPVFEKEILEKLRPYLLF